MRMHMDVISDYQIFLLVFSFQTYDLYLFYILEEGHEPVSEFC